jgi:hypothetical protein
MNLYTVRPYIQVSGRTEEPLKSLEMFPFMLRPVEAFLGFFSRIKITDPEQLARFTASGFTEVGEKTAWRKRGKYRSE